MTTSFSVNMKFSRSTKGTHVYKAPDQGPERPRIDTLYITKNGTLPPTWISVQVTSADGPIED